MVGSAGFRDSCITVSESLTASCMLRNPSCMLMNPNLNVDADHAKPITLFMIGAKLGFLALFWGWALMG